MVHLNKVIGEHIFSFQFNDYSLIAFFQKQFKTCADGKSADTNVVICKGYGRPFLNYDVKVMKNEKQIVFKRADYKITADPSYSYAEISVYDELALKHALMNLYSSYIVHKNWGILLHSSCVLEKNHAHIFTGHSGAGKSTAAMLSHPRPLFSDEATVLKIDAAQVTAFDSPFRSELHDSALVPFAELKSINLIHQSLVIERNQISKSAALMALFDKVFYWPSEKSETKRILTMLKDLVNQTEIFDLYFQKNDQFWEMIS
ncbi:hypothetical protein [Metabacillus indicus]|uniref:hypothetical protein n=1 Tax=Metabacillus indicus TaxID=246786 RepID=UPI0004931CD2|nr:hypothetical protein [Metabacillus indicus]KEZ50313.1 hypothetical protein AZ46_0206380 [Metabacillus indicus LMG 22858]